MTTFHLTVVTPDGCAFDGQAERIVCRAIDGDLAILAKHGDYCTALGMGEAHIVDAEGQRLRTAVPGLRFVFLDIGRADAQARVAARAAHFFSASLIDSQFATLEVPTGEPGVLRVDAMAPLPQLQTQVSTWLHTGDVA